MEHRLVFAVFAEKRDIVAEIHILQMIGDKTPVAALDAFAKLCQNLGAVFNHFPIVPKVSEKCKRKVEKGEKR